MGVVFAVTLVACTVTFSLPVCFIGRYTDIESMLGFVVCLLLGFMVPVSVFRTAKALPCHKVSSVPFLDLFQA